MNCSGRSSSVFSTGGLLSPIEREGGIRGGGGGGGGERGEWSRVSGSRGDNNEWQSLLFWIPNWWTAEGRMCRELR